MVQPLVDSVRTEGETSVFVLDGEVVSQARKRPAAGEIRVHEKYGGTTVAVAVTDEAADLARRTVAAAERLLGERLDYARVDAMRLADGTLAVSELEVTEPGLYLEVLPGNAGVFAASWCASGSTARSFDRWRRPVRSLVAGVQAHRPGLLPRVVEVPHAEPRRGGWTVAPGNGRWTSGDNRQGAGTAKAGVLRTKDVDTVIHQNDEGSGEGTASQAARAPGT